MEEYLAEEKVRDPRAVEQRDSLKEALDDLLWAEAHSVLQNFSTEWHGREGTIVAPATYNPTKEDLQALGPRLAAYYNPHLDELDPEKSWDLDKIRSDGAHVRNVAKASRKTIEDYELGLLLARA